MMKQSWKNKSGRQNLKAENLKRNQDKITTIKEEAKNPSFNTIKQLLQRRWRTTWDIY